MSDREWERERESACVYKHASNVLFSDSPIIPTGYSEWKWRKILKQRKDSGNMLDKYNDIQTPNIQAWVFVCLFALFISLNFGQTAEILFEPQNTKSPAFRMRISNFNKQLKIVLKVFTCNPLGHLHKKIRLLTFTLYDIQITGE